MALQKQVTKFKDIDLVGQYYEPEWEGSHAGGTGPEADIVRFYRKDIVRYGSIDDDNSSYSFDDYSLIQIKGHGWFLLNTSGCSCPSPNEMWVVTLHEKTLPKLRKAFEALAAAETYGVIMNQLSQFIELFDFAKEQTKANK
jgi:hypothetical protein